ncbi:MAG: hypothetical protein HQL30_02485 [Candidatus Omnitrophica bacterium]|nr:hypothetical protein [Candidatus Omnitrophota bacterium]
MEKIIRRIISSLMILGMVKRYKGRAALLKIKAAEAYVGGVRSVRVFFVNIMFVMFSFILLVSGLFLIHTAFFKYSLWSVQVKFITALVLGGMEFLAAIIILFYLFREENWVKYFGIQKVLNAVIDGKPAHKK